MEESTSRVKSRASDKKKDKHLPWWIELLFVQIGLPEKLLVKYLSLEKKIKLNIQDKKNTYKLITLIGLVMLYLYPIVEESRHRNICINSTSTSLRESMSNEKAKSISVNYCNGGNSSISED